ERIERLRAEEDLAKVRPDLDGNEIMKLLGIPPGPLVGEAWRHLKELRLERGPLPREEAEAELLAWARERGLVPHPDHDSGSSARDDSQRPEGGSRSEGPRRVRPAAPVTNRHTRCRASGWGWSKWGRSTARPRGLGGGAL